MAPAGARPHDGSEHGAAVDRLRARPGKYDVEFPNLPVDGLRFHTIALYVLSGGVAMRSLVPGAFFTPLLALNGCCSRLAACCAA